MPQAKFCNKIGQRQALAVFQQAPHLIVSSFASAISREIVRSFVMNRLLAILPSALSAAASPSQVSAQESPGQSPGEPWHMMHHWGMMHDWGSGWGMIFGPLYMIAWLAILLAAIVALIRWMGIGNTSAGVSTRTAREILDERFASGDIDQDEYEKRRRALNS
jgi:putative membrane protein